MLLRTLVEQNEVSEKPADSLSLGSVAHAEIKVPCGEDRELSKMVQLHFTPQLCSVFTSDVCCDSESVFYLRFDGLNFGQR